MRLLDSHVHVWDVTTGVYAWLGGAPAGLRRTHWLTELEPSPARWQKWQCLLVQAADHPADTAAMLMIAAGDERVAGVVAYLPIDRPRELELGLTGSVANPLVVGVRNLIHTWADPAAIAGPACADGLRQIEAAGLPYDFVTADWRALEQLTVLGDRFPGLRLVLDHLGKPPPADAADFARWEAWIEAASRNPNLSAKISGLSGSDSDLKRWIDAALDAFGPDRLMLGSDWPITTTGETYDATVAGLLQVVATRCSATEIEQIAHRTASSVYAVRPRGRA
jgi:L-fuconolactonase